MPGTSRDSDWKSLSAMPERVAEAIVWCEAHNLQLDEELANGQRKSIELQEETLVLQRENLALQRGMPALSVHRVNECLRLLRKHACIRSRGGAEDGAPVYVPNQD